MGLSADVGDSITPFSLMVTVIFNNNSSVRSMNSRKVISLTFRRFHRKWLIWNYSKKNARALCFWNCLCSNYFQFQTMQTIDSFLCPDSFKKEKKTRFSSEYRGLGNDLRNNFLRCHSQFLVQSDYRNLKLANGVATTNWHDEEQLQIYLVNRAFKEVAGNSYLMSSLYSHRHFEFSIVWFEHTYHFCQYLSRDLLVNLLQVWRK